VHRKDTALSSYGERFVAVLRGNMDRIAGPARAPRRPQPAKLQGVQRK